MILLGDAPRDEFLLSGFRPDIRVEQALRRLRDRLGVVGRQVSRWRGSSTLWWVAGEPEMSLSRTPVEIEAVSGFRLRANWPNRAPVCELASADSHLILSLVGVVRLRTGHRVVSGTPP